MGHLDVINMANREFIPTKAINFEKKDPILRKLVADRAIVPKSGGHFFEQRVVPRAGTRGIEIDNTGLTVVPRASYDITELTGVSPVYLAYDIIITAPEMDKIGRQNAEVFDLVSLRKDAAAMGAYQDLMAHFLSNQSPGKVFIASELANIVTLDGDHSGGTLRGCTNGLLDYVAPASQSDTVFDLAKSVTNEHYNQYNEATDWATDGLAKLRKTQYECRIHDVLYDTGPDIIAMTNDAFLNLQATSFGNVRTQAETDTGLDFSAAGVYRRDLGGADCFSSPYIDPSQYITSSAQGGVAIHLNTKYLQFFTLLQSKNMWDGMKDAFQEDPGQQRIYVCRVKFHGNFFLENLKGHGVTANIDA